MVSFNFINECPHGRKGNQLKANQLNRNEEKLTDIRLFQGIIDVLLPHNWTSNATYWTCFMLALGVCDTNEQLHCCSSMTQSTETDTQTVFFSFFLLEWIETPTHWLTSHQCEIQGGHLAPLFQSSITAFWEHEHCFGKRLISPLMAHKVTLSSAGYWELKCQPVAISSCSKTLITSKLSSCLIVFIF